MGERGQIKINDTGVYLYTHWTGYTLKSILQKALNKKVRWDDAEYFTRILFDVMTELEGEETGYGIGTSKHGDLGYPLLIVDTENQLVKEKKTTWTFEEFIKEEFKED